MSDLEENTVVKRTLRRKIQIPTYTDPDESTHRYQVYRGLSPDTSNRLELKIKALEEALEGEKHSKAKLEHEVQLLVDEVQVQTDLNEELTKKLNDQTQISRSKDQELLKFRKEHEILLKEHEGNEFLMKKKFQDVASDLTSQMETLAKNKSRLEGEKRKMILELSEGASHLESVSASKRQLESKIENLEGEIRRLKLEIEERSKQTNDVSESKSRLVHEHTEVVNKLRSVETVCEGLSREKSKFLQEIDQLKIALDEAEAVKPHLVSTINGLQSQLQALKYEVDDETQAKQLLQTQILKLQADLNSQKIQFEKDLGLTLQDGEAQRKKLVVQMGDGENQLNLQMKRNAKLEKDVNKLNSEIKELFDDLALHKSQLSEALKRMKGQENVNNDQRINIEQLQHTIEQQQQNEERLQTEFSKVKSILKSVSDELDQKTRDLKLSSDALKESKEEAKEFARQLDSIIIHKNNAEKEILRLNGKVTEVERLVGDKENQIYVLSNEVKSVREELKTSLNLKEEQITEIKRAHEKANEEHLRKSDEDQSRHRSEINRIKRLFENELLELRTSNENSLRQVSEATRQNKSLNNRIKELEGIMGRLEMEVEEGKSQATMWERKRYALESQLEQVHLKLESSEQTRRNLDLAHQETEQHLEHLTSQLSTSQAELKRSQAEVLSLKFFTDEIVNNKMELEGIIEKQRHEVERLNEALNMESERSSGAERLVQELEKKVREGRMALEEVEASFMKEERKTNAKIAARCQGIEAELEGEQRKVKELSTENRKFSKQIQELRQERDNDVAEKEEKDRALENSNLAIYKLKKNLQEAEEVITLVTNKYKRLQQQLNETATEQLETHTTHTSLRASSQAPVGARLSIARTLKFVD